MTEPDRSTPLRKEFSAELSVLREAANLSVRELGARTHFSKTIMADIAAGRKWPTEDQVRRYAKACGADPEALVKKYRAVNAAEARQNAPDLYPIADPELSALVGVASRYWIDTELRRPLELTGRLPVRLVEPGDPPRPLSADQTVAKIFQQSSHLLVLGEAGSGKSMLLLELLDHLTRTWPQDPSRPAPVIVPLSSWAQRRAPLDAWLAEQLDHIYNVPPERGRILVRARRVLPLLDGLDEVASHHREACVEAINDYQTRGGAHPLVVTCRTAAHASLTTSLRPRQIIEVQQLTPEDVQERLDTTEGPLTAVANDIEVAEMLRTPLFLAMATFTYGSGSTVPAPIGQDESDLRETLFRDYVTRRLAATFLGKPQVAVPTPPYPAGRCCTG